MVHPMVRRRVEDPFQGSAVINYFCVNPKLKDQIELEVDEESGKRNPEESQRLVETEGKVALEQGLSEGRAEVVFLGGVMNLVTRPRQVDF